MSADTSRVAGDIGTEIGPGSLIAVSRSLCTVVYA
jgi:hypothetical protein